MVPNWICYSVPAVVDLLETKSNPKVHQHGNNQGRSLSADPPDMNHLLQIFPMGEDPFNHDWKERFRLEMRGKSEKMEKVPLLCRLTVGLHQPYCTCCCHLAFLTNAFRCTIYCQCNSQLHSEIGHQDIETRPMCRYMRDNLSKPDSIAD